MKIPRKHRIERTTLKGIDPSITQLMAALHQRECRLRALGGEIDLHEAEVCKRFRELLMRTHYIELYHLPE